jgi:MFS family permease
LNSDWSWRIPVIIQAVPSVIVAVLVWTIPESPRYLWGNRKEEQARAVLTKYHGNGDPNSAVVQLECKEIKESIDLDADLLGKRWWDYRPLFSTRAARYRMWLVMLVTVFSQFIGGAVISYYLVAILQDVGITGSSQQLLLNALNTVFRS